MHRKLFAFLTLATLLGMAVALPFILHGAQAAIASMYNAPVRWIPPDSESLREFREYTEQFDVHEMVQCSTDAYWHLQLCGGPFRDLVRCREVARLLDDGNLRLISHGID